MKEKGVGQGRLREGTDTMKIGKDITEIGIIEEDQGLGRQMTDITEVETTNMTENIGEGPDRDLEKGKGEGEI